MRCFLLSLLLLCWGINQVSAQGFDTTKRKAILLTTSGVLYAGTIIGLATIWYDEPSSRPFHFFNDGKEWKGMDKCGHAFTSYSQGYYAHRTMLWAGYTEKQAAIYGGSIGFLLQLPIEVLDGFSDAWGASLWDVAANTAGSALFIGQQLGWKEQRLFLKFSWSPTDYPSYRPNVLGSNLPEQIIKDYNGQTYWLSANLKSLTGSQWLPPWLNFSVGYGADGMTGGFRNIPNSKHIQRSPQWYIAPDIDLSRIKTRSPILRTLLISANCLKFPAPSLEYSPVHGFRWHLLYF